MELFILGSFIIHVCRSRVYTSTDLVFVVAPRLPRVSGMNKANKIIGIKEIANDAIKLWT